MFGWQRLLVALLVGACSDEDPAPQPVIDVPPAHDMSCQVDADCEVVDVTCGGRAAAPHALARELREQWEREASTRECGRASWVPPEALQAFCTSGSCTLDEVDWPDLRGCERDTECVLFEGDPCGTTTAVRRDKLEEARELIGAEGRAEACARRAAALGDLPIGLGELPAEEEITSVRCAAGYCRP